MTEQTNDCRKEFEAHPQFKYLDFTRELDAWNRGKYVHSHVQALFEGYQAAYNRATPQTDKDLAKRLANHKFDTSKYIVLNDGLKRNPETLQYEKIDKPSSLTESDIEECPECNEKQAVWCSQFTCASCNIDFNAIGDKLERIVYPVRQPAKAWKREELVELVADKFHGYAGLYDILGTSEIQNVARKAITALADAGVITISEG